MKIYEQILLLVKEVIKNKKIDGGFPVAAMFIDSHGRIIGQPLVNKRSRDFSEEDRKTHKHHSEQLILKGLKDEMPKNPLLVSILPPCGDCINAISEETNKMRVFYFTDNIRNKLEKESYKEKISKNNIKIKEIKFNKRWWKRVKIYYWFMIVNVLHTSLNHGGVDVEDLQNKIDIYVEKIEHTLKTTKSNKEITYIKNVLKEFKKTS